jgi:hypothetical protein
MDTTAYVFGDRVAFNSLWNSKAILCELESVGEAVLMIASGAERRDCFYRSAI